MTGGCSEGPGAFRFFLNSHAPNKHPPSPKNSPHTRTNATVLKYYNMITSPKHQILSDIFCITQHVHYIPIVSERKKERRIKTLSMVYLKRQHPLLELP